MKTTFCLIVALLALATTSDLIADAPNQNLSNGIIAARKKGAAMMQQYSWNRRSELIEDGKMQDIRIFQVSLGPDSQPQSTLINNQPGKLPDGFFRKRGAEEQRKDLEKLMHDVEKLVEQYTLGSAGKVTDFIATAQIQVVTSPEGKSLLQITGNNVVIPGDTFTMSVDATTMQTVSVKVSTFYNGDPITASATFRTIKSGLNHMQYTTVDYPNKKTTLMLHNYDYVPND